MKTTALSFVLSALMATLLPAQDTDAPQLASIAITPGSVNVTSGDQDIRMILGVTDDVSGLEYGTILLYNMDGDFVESAFFNSSAFYLKSGTPSDGTYQVDVTVPQYAKPGLWTTQVVLTDYDGHSRRYGGSYEDFPNPGDEMFAVNNTGVVDTGNPVLVSAALSPATVDPVASSQDISITLEITDDISGFDFGYLYVYDPLGVEHPELGRGFDPLFLVSGTTLDGTYVMDVTIPQGSMEGLWKVTVFLRDRVSNSDWFDHWMELEFNVGTPAGPAGDLGDATDATQYAWTSGGDSPWVYQTATTYDGIDAAQCGAIDDNETSTMSLEVEGPGFLRFYWKVDSEQGWDTLSVEVLGGDYQNEISGDEDWAEESFWVPSGPQTIVWTYAKDSGAGVGQDSAWVDRVHFETEADTEPPTLQAIRITPDPVEVGSGDQEVTITLEISDDSNGAEAGSIVLFDSLGAEHTHVDFDASNQLSGDPWFGTYQVSILLPESDFIPTPQYEPGLWRVEIEIVENDSFDLRRYGPGDDPFPIPGAETFLVTTGSQDLQAPLLSNLSLQPSSVDVSSGDETFTATFHIADSGSGFDRGFIHLHTPTGAYTGSTYFAAPARVSGDAMDGDYSVELTIPQYAMPGAWRIAVYLYDVADNFRSYPYSDAFPDPGSEEITVINSGLVDDAAPELQAITITPDTVDTSGSAQTLDITLTINEGQSGLQSAYIRVFDPTDTEDPSLFQYIGGEESSTGVYDATVTLPQGSMEGNWRCEVEMRDRVGNAIIYGPGESLFPNPGDELFSIGGASSSTYGNFIALHGLSGQDALPGSNPDHDVFNNAQELLLGLDPNSPDQANPLLWQVGRVGDTLRLVFAIDPSLTVTANGNHLEISDADGGSPFIITGQSANTLDGPWTDILPLVFAAPLHQVTLEITPGGSGFLRLHFEFP